jgi:hypothetical protein
MVFTGERTWGRKQAEEVIRRNRMEGEIVDLGKSPAEHLPHLYSGAEALVYTSLYEGFGMHADCRGDARGYACADVQQQLKCRDRG